MRKKSQSATSGRRGDAINQSDRATPARKLSPTRRGYNGAWAKASRAYRQRYPLCADCYARGILTYATDVDHINAWRGDRNLFWDETNWQSLCKSCHAHKTNADRNDRPSERGCSAEGEPLGGWAGDAEGAGQG